MQKKLITLAIAGLISAPTFAQSTVDLYGTIDFGYVSLGSHDRNGVKSRNAIDSGISKSNRLGFRGTEDLGNGLKAVFVLENGLMGDRQDANNGMFSNSNRQSYAGLQGSFGAVAFGRQYAPQHSFTGGVDPFSGKNGLGSSGNVLVQERRLNNLFTYTTPSFGGFKILAGWSFNGTKGVGTPFSGDNEKLENRADLRTWVVAPTFNWNKLFVGANYHAAKGHRVLDPVSGRDRNISALDVIDLYASYDFGFVKLGSTIGRRTTKKEVFATEKDVKLTQWMVGATFRMTPKDSILASYARASENEYKRGVGKARIGQWAVGYEHALSKRTVLYSQFAMQSHNSAFKENGFRSLVTDGPVGYVGASNLDSSALGYRRGFAVGMRHDF